MFRSFQLPATLSKLLTIPSKASVRRTSSFTAAGLLTFSLVFSLGAVPAHAATLPGTTAESPNTPAAPEPSAEPEASPNPTETAEPTETAPPAETTDPTPAPETSPEVVAPPEEITPSAPVDTTTPVPGDFGDEADEAAPDASATPAEPAEPTALPSATADASPTASAPPTAEASPPAEDDHNLPNPGAFMGQGIAKEQLGIAADAAISAKALSAKLGAKPAAAALWVPAGIRGMDVSGWQADSGYTRSTVNWAGEWSKGARFVYVKATEGNNFTDASRTSHLAGATKSGMLHGAYHFALPNQSSAVSQADYFVKNGGAWKADGKTLPPLLDIENNPYGANCYGLNQSAMINWIKAFSNRVQAKTGRLPMIYTNLGWWKSCTGDSTAFKNQPLHIAAYTGGAKLLLPAGWPVYSMWQFSSTGPFAGDSNVWNGSLASLKKFAAGTTVTRINGKDRYEVSAAVSKSTFPARTKIAYIASGAVYTDALSGSAAAGHNDGPVLLTGTGVLPYVIRTELSRLKPQRIVILGGPATVSNSVMGLLKKYSPSVSRISGKDRYVVSAGVSKSTFKTGTRIAYVASGAIYTDALSASALAGHQGGPVLLTAKTILPDAIRAELTRLKPQQIVVLGGTGSVSNSVMNLLKRYSPSVSRISGADRYDVSAAVSRSSYWVGTQTVYIASGAVYSDALSGSAAAARKGSPVLLTAPNVLPNSVRAELKRIRPQRIVILGGTGSVSNGVLHELQNYAR